MLGPVGALRERVAVEVIRNVHAASGIAVLEPGASHVAVLLEHDDLEPGLRQPIGSDEAGHAGTDDGDAEGAVGSEVFLAPGRLPQVFAQRELLPQQLEVVADRRSSGGVLEQVAQIVEVLRVDGHGAVLAQPLERAERELACLGLLLRRKPGRRIHEDGQVRPQVLRNEGAVVERRRERREQRGYLGVLERSAHRVVVGARQVSREVGHRRAFCLPVLR